MSASAPDLLGHMEWHPRESKRYSTYEGPSTNEDPSDVTLTMSATMMAASVDDSWLNYPVFSTDLRDSLITSVRHLK